LSGCVAVASTRCRVTTTEARPTSQAFVGPLSRHLLENVHVSKALVGTYALSLEDGLSTTDSSEAFTKALALGRATEVIILADSRKLGTTSFARAGRLDQVDMLVTDAQTTTWSANSRSAASRCSKPDLAPPPGA